MTCEICGKAGEGNNHPCQFENGCTCWRSVPCVARFRIAYNVHQYNDLSGWQRSKSRIIKSMSADDARQVLSDLRDNQGANTEDRIAGGFIGSIFNAELITD